VVARCELTRILDAAPSAVCRQRNHSAPAGVSGAMPYTVADLQRAEEFVARAEREVLQRSLRLEGNSSSAQVAAELAPYKFALQQQCLYRDLVRSSLLKSQLECHLDLAERHVLDGERYVSEQKFAIELLAAAGKPTADAALLLATYEFALLQKLRHRDQLRRRQASEAAAKPDEPPRTAGASAPGDPPDRQFA
jgi:hypothetical protein